VEEPIVDGGDDDDDDDSQRCRGWDTCLASGSIDDDDDDDDANMCAIGSQNNKIMTQLFG
jgi:hypothetical protein